MTDEQINIEIAKALGWRDVRPNAGWIPDGVKPGFPECANPARFEIPDYTLDLNSMHEAEKLLNEDQWSEYGDQIEMMKNPVKGWLHATARQKAEAFLKTLDLWKE